MLTPPSIPNKNTQPRRPTPPRAEGAAPTFSNLGAPRGPPSLAQRLLAAAWYIVPAMDASAIELPILKFIPALNGVMSFNFPWFSTLIELYYSSQFTPLVVFFAMYLAVVRNNGLHHFIRFHCMQAITLDICVMLLTLVRSYFPPDILWSPLLYVFDAFAWSAVAVPIVYCIVWAIRCVVFLRIFGWKKHSADHSPRPAF
jgi:uncharacterized membrane protein